MKIAVMGSGVQLTELPQLQLRVVSRGKFLPGQLRRHLEAGGKEREIAA